MRAIWIFILVITAIVTPTTVSAQNTIGSPEKLAAKAGTAQTPSDAQAESAEESSAAKLPVRRVILYKTGVGYFEHLGQIRGDQKVQIDFTSSQLNDVLQSRCV